MLFSALRRFGRNPVDADRIARAFARCFATDDGRQVLEHLHRQALFRVTDPGLPHDQLRFIEGQRQLVLWICQMAASGAHPAAHTPSQTASPTFTGDISHG